MAPGARGIGPWAPTRYCGGANQPPSSKPRSLRGAPRPPHGSTHRPARYGPHRAPPGRGPSSSSATGWWRCPLGVESRLAPSLGPVRSEGSLRRPKMRSATACCTMPTGESRRKPITPELRTDPAPLGAHHHRNHVLTIRSGCSRSPEYAGTRGEMRVVGGTAPAKVIRKNPSAPARRLPSGIRATTPGSGVLR